MNIFVGNLLFEATDADVQKVFARFGLVSSVAIVMDKKGRNSRGFGFVEMPHENEAYAAIAGLDGKEFMGRMLNVSPAHSPPEGRRSKVRATGHGSSAANYQQRHNARGSFGGSSRVAERKHGYKEGRRSRSFLAQRTESGSQTVGPAKRKNRSNPGRWRKKERSKPWEKGPESAVVKKGFGNSRRRHKPGGH